MNGHEPETRQRHHDPCSSVMTNTTATTENERYINGTGNGPTRVPAAGSADGFVTESLVLAWTFDVSDEMVDDKPVLTHLLRGAVLDWQEFVIGKGYQPDPDPKVYLDRAMFQMYVQAEDGSEVELPSNMIRVEGLCTRNVPHRKAASLR